MTPITALIISSLLVWIVQGILLAYLCMKVSDIQGRQERHGEYINELYVARNQILYPYNPAPQEPNKVPHTYLQNQKSKQDDRSELGGGKKGMQDATYDR